MIFGMENISQLQKIYHWLNTGTRTALSGWSFTEVTSQKYEVIKHDPIDQYVITVAPDMK